jgi:hypothetical protein
MAGGRGVLGRGERAGGREHVWNSWSKFWIPFHLLPVMEVGLRLLAKDITARALRQERCCDRCCPAHNPDPPYICTCQRRMAAVAGEGESDGFSSCLSRMANRERQKALEGEVEAALFWPKQRSLSAQTRMLLCLIP